MDADHSRIGGKGKGLVWLTQHQNLGYKVPEFDVIDTSYHDDFLRNRTIGGIIGSLIRQTGWQVVSNNTSQMSQSLPRRAKEKVEELHARFKGRRLAVRSSASVSEDNEKFSGAGIYDSVFLEERGWTQADLERAVSQVYLSVDSQKAVEYRRRNGLGDERMAVIVQELVEGCNGVAMSRHPSTPTIMPVSWSSFRGAAVSGDKDSDIHMVYLANKNIEEHYSGEIIFKTEDTDYWEARDITHPIFDMVKTLLPKYGREFELEFVLDLYNLNKGGNPSDAKPELYLLQIRPITKVSDKVVKFPDKKPILVAQYCMGAGEYVGPMVLPNDVIQDNWKRNEPEHYAYIAPRLDQTLTTARGHSDFFGPSVRHNDYNALTPKKKAMVITGSTTYPTHPGIHALTLANEQGILCLAGNDIRPVSEYEEYPELRRMLLLQETIVAKSFGSTLAEKVRFAIPLEEVGDYVHIVSDGLRGHVYQATRDEAVAFAKREGLSIPK